MEELGQRKGSGEKRSRSRGVSMGQKCRGQSCREINHPNPAGECSRAYLGFDVSLNCSEEGPVWNSLSRTFIWWLG